MLKPSLVDRLRAVVGTATPAVPRVLLGEGELGNGGATAAERAAHTAAVLGGAVHEGAGGRCVVVDRHYGPDDRHGRHAVANIVRTLQAAAEGFTALGRAWPGTRGVAPSAGPLLQDLDGLCVVDLETTGLAGGAGTQAFLVGCARLEGDGVTIRQFLSPGFEHERAQLQLVSEWMRDRTQLVTFNGRTFDVPLLEMRFSYHRLPWPWGTLPHLDALHPARRFWRDRSEVAGLDPDEGSCTLGVLERRLSGLHRIGDVAGAEIPTRYFQFARDGRPEPLAAVLEHNRLDLALHAAGLRPRRVAGRARPGRRRERPRVSGPGPPPRPSGAARRGRGLLRHRRRGRRPDGRWTPARRGPAPPGAGAPARRAGRRRGRGLARAAGAPAAPRRSARREAREALAIFHEHRARDFAAARTLVLDALAEPIEGRRRADAEHRLARLERKLSPKPGALIAQFDEEPGLPGRRRAVWDEPRGLKLHACGYWLG